MSDFTRDMNNALAAAAQAATMASTAYARLLIEGEAERKQQADLLKATNEALAKAQGANEKLGAELSIMKGLLANLRAEVAKASFMSAALTAVSDEDIIDWAIFRLREVRERDERNVVGHGG